MSGTAGPCPRQDVVSGTPLLRQEEEEDPRVEKLSSAGPSQATQVLESKLGEGLGCPQRPCEVGRAVPFSHPLPIVAANNWGLVAERLLDLAAAFSDVLGRVQTLVGRLLELHIFKLVALYTVWVALREVSTHRPTAHVCSSH